MAEPAPSKGRKVEYELALDPATGQMRRVAKGTAAASAALLAGPSLAGPRPAIASAVVRRAEEEEEVYNESGLVSAPPPPPPPPAEEEEVFNETGEVTGEAADTARRAAAATTAAATATATATATRGKKPRKAEVKAPLTPQEKVKQFYIQRATDLQHYTYTPEGNLEIKGVEGIPNEVLTLRAFSDLTVEEIAELDAARKEKIEAVETEYEGAMKELREAYTLYKAGEAGATAKQVVDLNAKLRDLSVKRNAAAYPSRWVKDIANPVIKLVLLDKPYEDRHMGSDVFLFKRNKYAIADGLGHYRERGGFRAGEQEGGGGVSVLFITTPEDERTGHLHPGRETEFVFNETKYASPYQAFQAERFKELQNEGMVKKILGTRSARTIKNLVALEPEIPANVLNLWEDILVALFTQNKALGTALKETGSSKFHVMEKELCDQTYGEAMANARTKLKEQEESDGIAVDEVKDSVISKKEQQKARTGAIINTFRKKF